MFNSKLTSPADDVSGAANATLTFSSHYLKSGNETATVLTYTADAIAKLERLTIPVPAGARNITITWSLTNGDNDWYWSVDNPHLTKN